MGDNISAMGVAHRDKKGIISQSPEGAKDHPIRFSHDTSGRDFPLTAFGTEPLII